MNHYGLVLFKKMAQSYNLIRYAPNIFQVFLIKSCGIIRKMCFLWNFVKKMVFV